MNKHATGVADLPLSDSSRSQNNVSSFRLSEVLYRQLFNNMSSCVAIYEAVDDGNDFIIKDFNKAAENAERVSKKDIVGKSVLKVFPGVEDFGLFKVLQRVWRTGKSEHFPLKQYKDKRITGWKQNYVYKLPNGDVVAIYDDITKEKQAEYQAEVSEVRYRRLFEAAKDGVFLVDFKTGMIIDVNPFLVDLLGYSKQEFLNKHLWEVGVFKDIAASKENFVTLQKKRYVRFEDLPLETKSGKKIDVEFVANAYEVDSTTIIQCNIRDITGRRIAENLIQRNEVYLRATLDCTTDGILAIDNDRKILHTNNRFVEFWKIPQALTDSKDDKKLLSYVLDQLEDPQGFLDKVEKLYKSK